MSNPPAPLVLILELQTLTGVPIGRADGNPAEPSVSGSSFADGDRGVSAETVQAAMRDAHHAAVEQLRRHGVL